MKIVRKLFFFFVALCLGFTIQGQTEEEIVGQANALFKEEKFVDATPLYLRLLSLQPKSTTYNYKYGACLLYNSNKKNEAIRYLKFATENPTIEPEAFYYMGRAYHLNYLFNDAVRSYDKYASLVDKKESTKYDIPRLVEMCQNGRKLLTNYSEVIVYDKKEIEADKFFRLYDLKDIGGSILVTADFQSKLDKKKNHTPLVYFSKSATEIYYSSYGDDGINGKEIYRRVRKPTGGWDEPELVKGEVNTKFDEDFAYRSQDGKYLFFCSKGHNSMGGYDVFRSEYNPNTDSFMEAENMDFAISSPDDDLFFLVDQNNENGYFASSRQSETGKLFVYKIRVEKLPAQLSIIAGRFESKLKPIGTKIFIEVHDANSDALVGEFKSDEDGKVIITFPSGGEYKYRMKLSDDSQTFSQNVTIPNKKGIKPLRQNILHYVEDGKEVIHISNRFDEVVTEKDDILAELFSEKAQLEPNAQKFNIEQLNILRQQGEILAEAGAANLNLSELATNLVKRSDDIHLIEKNAVVFEQKTAVQIEKEVEKIKEIDKMIAKNTAAFKTAETNSLTSKNLVLETSKLLSDRKIASDKIEDFLSVNQKVQDNKSFYLTNKKSAESWNELGVGLKQLLEEDKNSEALALISENKETVKSAMELFIDEYQNKASQEITELNVELTDISQKKYNFETSSKDLQNNIDFMEKNLYEGKSNDPNITTENIALKRSDLKIIGQKIKTMTVEQEEKRNLKEQLEDELSEFMLVENSPQPASNTNFNQAKDSWNSLKNTPVGFKGSDLAEEIKKVESENLAADASSNENEITGWSNEEWNNVISPNYEKSILEIKNNLDLSEMNKTEAYLALEKDRKSAIQVEIVKKEAQLKENSNDSGALQDKARLDKILQESNSKIADLILESENQKSISQANSLNKNTIVQSIDKSYEEIFDFLTNDVAGEPLGKLKSLDQHDKAFLLKIDERTKEVQQKLASNSSEKPLLSKELELLTGLRTEKIIQIEKRAKAIQELESNLASATQTKTEEESKNEPLSFKDLSNAEQEEKILDKVNSTYLTKKGEIVNSDNSDAERWSQLISTNDGVISQLETEKKKLKAAGQTAELTALNRIQEKIIEENNQTKLNLIAVSEESSDLIARIDANYQQNKEGIANSNALSETERERQLIDLNQGLLANLATEKNKFIALGKENPENSVVQAKIDEIDQIQAEYAQIVAANESKLKDLESSIAQNPNANSTQKSAFSRMNLAEQEATILNRVNSNYNKEIKKISKSNGSEKEKLTQLLALENDLLREMSKEKEALDAQNQSDEIAAIERIEAETVNLIAEQKTKLADIENQLAINTNPVNTTNSTNTTNATNSNDIDFSMLSAVEQEATIFEKVNPTYSAEKEKINSSASTEKEKLIANLNLDKALLNNLADEKEKLNKTTQEAEFEAIKRIEELVNTAVSTNQLKLLASPETESELITRLAKDYQKNKDLLINNQALNAEEKAKRQIGVDEALMEFLKKEMQKFSTLSRANPSVAALQEKEQFIATTIENKKSEIAQLQSIVNGSIPETENNPSVQPSVANKYKVIDDFRSEFLGASNKGIMELRITANSLETLKSEQLKLDTYEKELQQLEIQFQELEKSRGENLQAQLKLIQTELIAVENKKRQYAITIGDLEREFIAENNQNQNESNFKIDNELEKISKEEQALVQKLDGDITSIKEIKKIEKQLVKLADQKAGRETEILKQATKEVQKENQKKLEVLREVPTSTVSERVNLQLAQSRAFQLDNESKILEEQAKRTNDNESASQLMEKAFAKQKQASEILEIAYVDNSVAKMTEGKISTLSTRNELELRKASLLMDESNVNSEIKNIESELKATKKESEEKLLFAKRNELSKERDLILNQIAYVDKKINQLTKPVENSIDPAKKETELSYVEEVKISSSLEYREISRIANEVISVENEITFLLKSIENEKQATRKLIETGLFDENQVNQSDIDAGINSIQEKEKQLVALNSKLEEKKATLAAKMPFEESKTNKIENLLLRGIEPIASNVSDYVSIPKDGFSVDLNVKNVDKNNLTIETEKHRGLMFRVQVGAFSKPLEHEAFQEFSPVTGEKRSSGLVVYMAGYFDKSTSASEAQKTIRSLGYSDAFVVAYCDGERITLSEGRRLESTNSCIPIQLSELTINRTVAVSPKDTTKLITRELDYHKAPGAAPAAPVEMKKGLFYTVQVGVYNRPVDLGTLKNLSPLITKRLPNGQIRYSAGIFVSIEEAMPKRKEAIEKGISDAFITAYYGSERISLTEAENLLREKGKGIIEKTAIGIVKDVQERQVAEEKLQEAIVEVEKKKFVEGMGIQLVSKQQFDEFPRDRLNRFNKHVSFYFDQNDRRLKSVVFSKIEDIPQIHFLRDEVDTVYFTEGDKMQIADENGFKKIVFVVQNGNLEGDVADYLFRLSFRKEFVDQGGQMQVILHDVPSNAIQPISDQLRKLKIRSNVE